MRAFLFPLHASAPLLVLAAAFTAMGTGVGVAQTWEPPVPGNDDKDWVQMSSGEWFAGEIKLLRDTELEFDSDELGILKLNWGDITVMRHTRVSSYRIVDAGVFRGTAVLENGTLRIRSTDGSVREFAQQQLLLIVSGAGRELDYWTAHASLGLVARSGNTDQTDFNSNWRIRRRTPRTRLQLVYLTNFSRIEETTNVENHNATATLDMVIRSGFYLTPVQFNYFRDRFQNIESRTTLGAGFGYEILNRSRVEWDVNLTGGYQDTRFASVEPGEDDVEDNFTLMPSTLLQFDLRHNVEVTLDYNLQVGVPDASRAFHHANGLVSVDVWDDRLTLDVSITWDRTESPKADSSGLTPKRDDFRTAFGVGLDL